MIDIHSHILPGMDDGSQSLPETNQLLQMLQQQGVRILAATSHFYGTQDTPEAFLERREKALQQLKLLDTDIKILPGAEVAYFDGMSYCQALYDLRLGDSKLLLVEMPFVDWTERMIHELCQLPLQVGLTPVLAHVERYRRRNQLPRFEKTLLAQGVCFQCNAEAFLCLTTRHWALSRLERGEICFLGSDAHNLTTRPPKLDRAAKVIQKKLGNDVLQEVMKQAQELLFI